MAAPTKTQILFAWSGHDPQNRPVQGEVAAPNISMARAMLNHQGIRLTNLQVRRKKRNGRISSKELALFTRQLATMLHAGVPLLQSFELVIRSTPNPHLVSLVERLHHQRKCRSRKQQNNSGYARHHPLAGKRPCGFQNSTAAIST